MLGISFDAPTENEKKGFNNMTSFLNGLIVFWSSGAGEVLLDSGYVT